MELNKNCLFEMLCKELYDSVSKQRSDGSFNEGCNGPYGDSETPIRNTSHFIFALSSMYEITGDLVFRDSVVKASRYLLNNKYINEDGVYICRNEKGKDKVNGVIGHAWIIEALLKARNLIDDDTAVTAEKIWKLHSFDYRLGIWAKPELSPSKLVFDHTFNHQLWFAACIAPLRLPEVDKQIKCFIEKNVSRVETYKNGIIYHRSAVGNHINWLCIDFFVGLRKVFSPLKNRHQKRGMYLHSAAYHTFNLYALAMLKESGYDNELGAALETDFLLQSLRSGELKKDLMSLPNIGVRYNPSGIEAAYALQIFGDKQDEEVINDWVEFQLEQTASDQGLLVNLSPDEATSAARVYEATRLFTSLSAVTV